MSTFRPLSSNVCLMAVVQRVYCVTWYLRPHGILQSIMTSSNREVFHVTLLLCGEPPITMESPHKGTVTWTLDISLLAIWKNVEQTFDWPVIRDAMTVTWRCNNALSSPHGGCWWRGVYLAPEHHEPSRQNRTVAYISSCIFLQSCPVVSATLRKTTT